MSSLERDETILATSLSAGQMAARLRVEGDHIEGMRTAGILFGVWHAKQGAFVYPDFQLDPCLDTEAFQELLAVLASQIGFDPAVDDRGGWARALALSTNELLSHQARANYTGFRT